MYVIPVRAAFDFQRVPMFVLGDSFSYTAVLQSAVVALR